MERDRSQHTPKKIKKKKKKQPTVEDLGISEETCYFSLFPPIHMEARIHCDIPDAPQIRRLQLSGRHGFSQGWALLGESGLPPNNYHPPQKKKKKLQVLQAGFKKIGTNQTRTLGNAVPPCMAVA